MRSSLRNLELALIAGCLSLPTGASAFVIFSASGPDTASITPTVDAFRAALGGINNGNNPGPLPTGRREINWDGAALPPTFDGTAPVTPFTVFQNTRGATFTTSGTGLTQAAATGGLLSLDLINPQYATLFAPFSPNRLFAPIGANDTLGVFSIPGTGGAVPAGVAGFGAVFSDVDLPDVTAIGFFTVGGTEFFSVPAFAGNQTFSFLGAVVEAGDPLIEAVGIITGTNALGPSENLTAVPAVDLVVMDDFLYGEPQKVPEPQMVALLGLLMIFALVWRRSRRR
jgi:hypothetical protein